MVQTWYIKEYTLIKTPSRYVSCLNHWMILCIFDEFMRRWWPWAKTIYEEFEIWFFAAIKLNILRRIIYYLICFKDECDTLFAMYSDERFYLMKFLSRDFGVLHRGLKLQLSLNRMTHITRQQYEIWNTRQP